MKELDDFYLRLEEPNRATLLALRDIILAQDEDIAVAWKYSLPFFCYKGKMFCYFWFDKKTKHPYIGMVEGKHLDNPKLVTGNRSRIKILPIDPNKDLPIKVIKTILKQALDLYRKGVIKIKRK